MVTPQHILMERAQAARIDKLRREVEDLQRKARSALSLAASYKPGYDYWMAIQRAIQESEIVREEFERFLVACHLALDEPIPGLTAPEKDQLELPYV